jgi:hypothetical protein
MDKKFCIVDPRLVGALPQVWTSPSGLIIHRLRLVGFNKSLNRNTTAQPAAYTTSSSQSHLLLPLLAVTSSTALAVTYLSPSTLINILGGREGFALMAMFTR